MKNFRIIILINLIIFSALYAPAQSYMTPNQLNDKLSSIQRSNPSVAKIHKLADSYRGYPVLLLELGPELTNSHKMKPAILVVGNTEGDVPLASVATIRLAEMILERGRADSLTWYLICTLNPDALAKYFNEPLMSFSYNNRPVNGDHDEATDEDGPEDLNGDGLITMMRVMDPEGEMILHPKDNRILRKADPSKGEKGVYKVYTEGIDNDGDGKYNEDPLGGVNNGINFPHLHPQFTPDAGLWPGSEPEVFSILKFVFEHPEIAMTMTYGGSNFCLVPPKGGRRGSVDLNKIQVPDNRLKVLGAEKGRIYTMEEIMEMAKPLIPEGVELTPSLLSSFLGLGAVVNPLEGDLKLYSELSNQYKEYLRGLGFDQELMEPERAKNGSIELWSYYHLGIHTFSMNFFSLPKPKDKEVTGTGITLDMLKEMKSEDFISLSIEKIDSLLMENNAQEKYKATDVVEFVKSGKITPAQLADILDKMPKKDDPGELKPLDKALLTYNDGIAQGKAFVDWQEFNHPTLGRVEIGGVVPFAYSTPPAAYIDSLLDIQIPWIFTLSEKLPDLKILKYKVKDLAEEIFELSIWVENKGYLPFPTEMGNRNMRPAPAVLLVEGKTLEMISGKTRTPITKIMGFQTIKYKYVLKKPSSEDIQVSITSANTGNDTLTISF